MEVNEYVNKIIDDFIRDITDNLFLYIERDDKLMKEYMTNVNRFGLDKVNIGLGTKIKERLSLENCGENLKPKSRLIKSYTCHKTME